MKGFTLASFVLGLALGVLATSSQTTTIPSTTVTVSGVQVQQVTDGRFLLDRASLVTLLSRATVAEDTADELGSQLYTSREANKLKLTASAYNATVRQCGNTKGITATGTKVHAGRTLAVSRDLRHLLGRRVRLMGDRDYGIFLVEDLMGPGRKRAVDVYMEAEAEAVDFGKRPIQLIPL